MTAVLWGSGFSARKMALVYVSPMMLNTIRFLVGAVLVAIFYILYRMKTVGSLDPRVIPPDEADDTEADGSALKPRTIRHQILGGFLMGTALAGAAGIQQFALAMIAAGKVSFYTSLYSIFVPIISAIFLRTRIGKNVWIGAVLATAGIYLISGGVIRNLGLGDILGLTCGIGFAIQILFIDKYTRDSDGIFLSVCEMVFAGLWSLILTLITGSVNTFALIMKAFWPLVYTSVFAFAIPYTLQVIGQKHAAPSVSAIIFSLESVFGLLFAMLILGDRMSLMQLAGCAVIFVGVIMAQLKRKPREGHLADKDTKNSRSNA